MSELRERIGLGVCALATLLAVCLHVVCLTHAGALWRDEAGGVQFATLLPWREMCRRLALDSFPVCFPAVVRLWSAVGLGGSDLGLRVMGFLIGLGLLGAIWLNGKLMSLRWPFISLALLANNLTVIVWGDSLRAYGLGCVFILLTVGSIWRLMQAPRRNAFLLAAMAATLSVHTLYQNAFLVLAACLAGCLVCARRRQWRTGVLVFSAGLIAGVSMAPYVPLMLEAQPWYATAKIGFDLERVGTNLLLAVGAPLDWLVWVWAGLLPLVFAAGWSSLHGKATPGPIGREDLPLFALLALVAGVVLFFVFLRLSELVTAPWYFLPLMAFGAVAMDAALVDWCRQFRLAAVLMVAVMAGVPFPASLKLAKVRRTNLDLIAAELQRQAKPGDCIVVTPFFYGITFERYFKGRVEWTTLPPFEDHRFYHGDQLKERLCSKPLLKRVLQEVTQALATGHTVWVVGEWPRPQPGETTPPELPAASGPDERFGFSEASFCTYAWERQAAFLIATRAEQMVVVPVEPGIPICEAEHVRLIRATGWRGEERTPGPP